MGHAQVRLTFWGLGAKDSFLVPVLGVGAPLDSMHFYHIHLSKFIPQVCTAVSFLPLALFEAVHSDSQCQTALELKLLVRV